MYAPELTDLFIKERLQDYEVVTEWNLLDIVAIEKRKETWYDTAIPKVHVYEVKSSRDDPYRIFEQLPEYLWLADTATLVLGQKTAVPKRLPKWLGVVKYNGENFEDLHIPIYKPYLTNETFNGRSGIYIAKYALPDNLNNSGDAPDWSFFTRFLKKWYVNSILEQKGIHKFCEYTFNERALIKYLKTVRNIQSQSWRREDPKEVLTEDFLDETLKNLTLDQFFIRLSEDSEASKPPE